MAAVFSMGTQSEKIKFLPSKGTEVGKPLFTVSGITVFYYFQLHCPRVQTGRTVKISLSLSKVKY